MILILSKLLSHITGFFLLFSTKHGPAKAIKMRYQRSSRWIIIFFFHPIPLSLSLFPIISFFPDFLEVVVDDLPGRLLEVLNYCHIFSMGFGINAAGARDTIAERKLLMVGIKPKDGQDKM